MNVFLCRVLLWGFCQRVRSYSDDVQQQVELCKMLNVRNSTGSIRFPCSGYHICYPLIVDEDTLPVHSPVTQFICKVSSMGGENW